MASAKPCDHDWVVTIEANPKTKRTTEIATCRKCKWRRLASQVRTWKSLLAPDAKLKKAIMSKDYGEGNEKRTYRVLVSPKVGPYRRCIG